MQKISENLSTMEEQHGRRRVEREMSPGRVHAVEFVSQQYDVLTKFKEEAGRQIQELAARVDEISTLCDRITKSIEASEAYSYRYNLKIVGVPTVAERESPQQTGNICLKLFAALGVGFHLEWLPTGRTPLSVNSCAGWQSITLWLTGEM